MLGDLAETLRRGQTDQTVFAKEKVGVVARRPAASWLLVSSEQKGSEIKKLKRTQIVSSWPARRTSDLLRRSVRPPDVEVCSGCFGERFARDLEILVFPGL